MYIIIAVIIVVNVLLSILFYGVYNIGSQLLVKALCRSTKKGRVVALTFDDGPCSVQTPKVLGVLKEYGAKATFFCIGKQIVGNEDVLRQIKSDGHLIGNHTYDHSNPFPFYNSAEVADDLKKCDREIERVVGEKTLLFRPPFGVVSPAIAKVVNRLGYITVGWNIRSKDTNSEECALKIIKRKLKPWSVILLHDHLSYSDTLLVKILDYLKEQNYTVERVDRLFDLEKTAR